MQTESAGAEDRPLRKVSKQQSQTYYQSLKKFEQAFEKQASIEDSHYFIVSVKFLNTWRDFCMSQQPQRIQPIVMNEDIIDSATKQIIKGLSEKQHFQILSSDTYHTLRLFHKNEIKRKTVTIGTQKRVPIYLNNYSYIPITLKFVKEVDYLIKRKEPVQIKLVEQSQNALVEDLGQSILENEEKGEDYQIRIWKVSKNQTTDQLLNHISSAIQKLYSIYHVRIKGFGKKLDNDCRIEDVKLEEGDYFVAEIKQKGKKWFLETGDEKQCQGCYDYTDLKFPCKCEKVSYCSSLCLDKDKIYHMRRCEYAQLQELNKTIDMSFTEQSKRGKVGLRNLGNTCFMNSCLQCLSHTQPLTNYFVKKMFEVEINKENKIGTKGKLAKNYAAFIKGMWCDRQSVFSPDSVKSAVSSINPMFSGYAQHDSQQFFSFLIDGLHQDLNRIKVKPYVQSVESNNRSDSVVASQSWIAYIKRNQSIITDLMTGQYKSKVTCPTCNKQSVTFDPYITVTLPISETTTNSLDCFFFHKNFQKKTKLISFSYSGKANLVDWKKNIANTIQVDASRIEIYLVSMYQGIYLAGRQSLLDIIYKKENQRKNLFVFELNDEDINMKERVQLTTRLCNKSSYSRIHSSVEYDNLWFKFPLFFEKKETNGLDIYKKILKFLFPTAYKVKKSFFGKATEDLAGYMKAMLTNRPFKLFLKYKRKIQKTYMRVEYFFEQEIEIKDDMSLEFLLEKGSQRECELDARFSSEGQSAFQFANLKQHDDLTRKTKSSYEKQDKYSTVIELKDCFINLSEEEELEQGNQWYCSNCREHKLAKKVLEIYKAPKILILHLKRFKNKGVFKKQKNETKVMFPELLDMSPYLIDKAPIISYNQQAAQKEILITPKYSQDFEIKCSQEPLYELYAVSNHYGGLGGGHYTAYAKNNGEWYDFNDSSVRQVPRQAIQGSSAYMLFYKRKEQ